jgi:hypothetical protein
MVPICRENGCQVHRGPGPRRDACVKACVLGQDERRVPADLSPVAPPQAIPALAEPPPKPVFSKPRRAEHKRAETTLVHLWTGKRETKLPNWRSFPLGKPPWDRSACGILGHNMSQDAAQVTCKACLRTHMVKGRT